MPAVSAFPGTRRRRRHVGGIAREHQRGRVERGLHRRRRPPSAAVDGHAGQPGGELADVDRLIAEHKAKTASRVQAQAGQAGYPRNAVWFCARLAASVPANQAVAKIGIANA